MIRLLVQLAATRVFRAATWVMNTVSYPVVDDSDLTGCRCGTCWDCVTASVYALFPQHPDVGYELDDDDLDTFLWIEKGLNAERGETR